ncbi:MAG TPA: SGNH/GDSL hydrolase family protein [Thermoguttaceae bacterium]|nr:SGNH/GDSL hydrolase family protein [Thermoguttaceae bacterium]
MATSPSTLSKKKLLDGGPATAVFFRHTVALVLGLVVVGGGCLMREGVWASESGLSKNVPATAPEQKQSSAQTPAVPPLGQGSSPTAAPKPENRWEANIRKFEEMDRRSPPKPGGILFVGSSSIVGWDLKKFFPDLPVLNRGFGGSQLADVVYFADRIVLPYKPKIIVLYAGDNDLAAGKTPEQVAADYAAFVQKVHAALPDARIIYITIKPSVARWRLIDKIRQANRLIRERSAKDDRLIVVDIERAMLGPDGLPRADLLQKDGLHLNEAGYQIWSDRVRPHLKLPP